MAYLLSADKDSWDIGGDLSSVGISGMLKLGAEDALSDKYISALGYYSDYYRKGALERSNASFLRNLKGEIYLSNDSPVDWEFLLRNNNSHCQINFLNHENQMLSFHDDRSVTDFDIRFKPNAFVLGTGATVRNGLPPAFYFSGVWEPGDYGAIGTLWQRSYFRPSLSAHWHNEQAEIRLFGVMEESKLYLETPSIVPFHSRLVFSRTKWIRDEVNKIDASLEPWGSGDQYHWVLTYDNDVTKVSLGARGLHIDLMAYGIKSPYPFSKITAFDVDIDGLFVSGDFDLYHNRFKVELERLHWNGMSRGHLEFWPFTSGFTELLGLRRYFLAETDGELWRLHLSMKRTLSEKWSGAFGINLVDVYPTARVKHWMPEFLLFGKTDEQTHVLNTHRFLAGMLHLSAKYLWHNWEIKYTISQAVPIKSWKRSGVAAETDPSESSDATTRPYGGGFHKIEMRLFF
ncbi:MAG: hypothetical protein GF315_05925 [candidate division Zixibacteria bacterium]|nr:hypothetical protein [candidate division Zixibacteria bacterium]